MENLVAYMAYQNSNLLIKQENKNSKKKRIQKNVSKYSTHWMDGTMGFIQNRKSLWIGYSNTKKVQQNEKTDAITTLNS